LYNREERERVCRGWRGGKGRERREEKGAGSVGKEVGKENKRGSELHLPASEARGLQKVTHLRNKISEK
jgi:hypothetical protein